MLKKICPIALGLLFTLQVFAQSKAILVFDLINGTKDSITDISFDTTISQQKTPYFIGKHHYQVADLPQSPPVNNTFPNSEFTKKEKVTEKFDISQFPIRASIKLFSVKADTLKNHCSGMLISKRHVLTAAHCVSSFGSDTIWSDSIIACPIYNNGKFSQLFECSPVRKIYLFKNWDITHSEDFTILELDDPIGEKTGWVGVGFNKNDQFFTEGIYFKFSYPATTILQVDSNEYNGDTLYYGYGKISRLESHFIGIKGASGISGESGSSIIHVKNGMDYTSYGVLSFSKDLRHNRIVNSTFFAIKEIIGNDTVVGTEEKEIDHEISLYPNPARDWVIIEELTNLEIQEIQMVDNLGREVKLINQNVKNKKQIDISHLKNGLYHLIVKFKEGSARKKLIVLRN